MARPAQAALTRQRALLVGTLVLLPAVVFLVPVAFGHLFLPGDDLTQNYPLRLLVGRQVRSGHLPLWDAYEWSGTPLLGGFNAGAFHPLSLLFAALPAPVAWGLGQALTSAVTGSGLYLFLRRRTGALPAWLGAVTFTWAGFTAAQANHLGLIQGQALIGWMLLAVDHLAGPSRGDRSPRGRGHPLLAAASLGLTGGLVALAGDPRAVSNVAVPVILYACWCLLARRGRLQPVVLLAAAGLLAGLLACAQLLPGLAAQQASQRAGVSMDTFGAGSLEPPLLSLLVSPFLLGGFGTLGLPVYRGDYNLAEVASYVGLLPVAAALSALAGLLTPGLLTRRRPRPRPREEAPGPGPGPGFWVGVTLVGILLALGSRTFLGHLLVHVPLYRGQRLQSRNLAIVDLGLSVLLAGWADRFLARRWRPGRLAVGAGLLAPAGAAVAVVVGLAWPGGYGHWLGSSVELFPRDWTFAGVSLVMAAAAAVVWLAGPSWGPSRRRLVVTAVVLADVGFFSVNASYGWASTSALGTGPGAPAVALGVGTGRFAVVDTDLVNGAYVRASPDLVRVPDLNILSGVRSIQGYGSIVAGRYDQVTGTHDQGSLNPAVVSSPLADRLDLALVLVEPTRTAPTLLAALSPPHWRPDGMLGGLLAFRNTHLLRPAWLVGPGRVSPAGSEGADGDGSAAYRVSVGRRTRLVRSEAWAPGWQAELTPAAGGGGRAVTGQVTADGLLQAVAVPPGDWVVRFSYRPARVVVGLVLAGAGLAGVAALAVAGAVLSRARRPTSP